MATFTNYATLSYNGGTTDSNTVTGELLATLSMAPNSIRHNDKTIFFTAITFLSCVQHAFLFPWHFQGNHRQRITGTYGLAD